MVLKWMTNPRVLSPKTWATYGDYHLAVFVGGRSGEFGYKILHYFQDEDRQKQVAFDCSYSSEDDAKLAAEGKVAEIVAGNTPSTLLGFPIVESDFLDLPKGVPIIRYGVYIDEED